MEYEKTKISSAQLLFLIAAFILGSSLLTSFMDDIAKQDAWLSILSAFVVSIPFILSYVWLYKLFPGKNFAEVNDIVYGPYLGKAITALYAAVFFQLLIYNTYDMANFYVGFVMPGMPGPVFLIVTALTCAYTVHKGIETIARTSLFVVAYFAVSITANTLLLSGHMDLSNFLPAFQLSAHDYVQSTHIFAALPFCEAVVFVMVFPSLNDYKKAGRYAVGGLAVAALVLLIVVFRNTAVLGPSAALFTDTSYEAARLIDIGDVLTRIELFVAAGITVALFIKISVLYYATVTGISSLCRVRSPAALIIPVGIIAVVFALHPFASVASQHENGSLYQPFFLMPFEVIPAFTVLIAKLRRLPEKR